MTMTELWEYYEMRVEMKTDILVKDDKGRALKDCMDEAMLKHLEVMHEGFRRDVEKYVLGKLHKPTEADYDRAMQGVI